MLDFSKLTREEVTELNEKRAKQLREQTNGFLNEPQACFSPVINDLRFNHGYIYLRPFLIQGQTGDKFELRVDDDRKLIHMAYIGVADDRKRQGHGSNMMEMITSIADKYGYDMDLTVEPKFGIGKRVLTKFYKKYGFEKSTKGSYDNFMVRKFKTSV